MSQDPADMTEKELLIELNRQVAYQSKLLEQLLEPEPEEQEGEACLYCGEKIPEHKQTEHMQQEHDLPTGVDVSGLYG